MKRRIPQFNCFSTDFFPHRAEPWRSRSDPFTIEPEPFCCSTTSLHHRAGFFFIFFFFLFHPSHTVFNSALRVVVFTGARRRRVIKVRSLYGKPQYALGVDRGRVGPKAAPVFQSPDEQFGFQPAERAFARSGGGFGPRAPSARNQNGT